MKRPEQHEIDTMAQRQFSPLLPRNWVCREQSKDYGIDYEIEVFEDGESTGIIFKMQLKGTKNIKLINNDTIISFSMDISNMKYLLEEINIPAILILADIVENNTYWVSLQSNKEIVNTYEEAKSKGQDSLTIHIPRCNILGVENSYKEILEEVSSMNTILGTKTFLDTNLKQFNNSFDLNEKQNVLEGLKEKVGILKYDKLQELLEADNYKKAINFIDKEIIDNSDTPVNIKVPSLLEAERAVAGLIISNDFESDNLDSIKPSLIKKLNNVTENASKEYKVFSEIYEKVFEMHSYIKMDLDLYMNKKTHVEKVKTYGGEIDPLWKAMISQKRYDLSRKISKLLTEISEKLYELFEENNFYLFAEGVYRLAESLCFLQYIILEEGIEQERNKLIEWIDNLLMHSIKIVDFLEDESFIFVLFKTYLLLGISQNQEIIEERFEETKQLVDNLITESNLKDELNSSLSDFYNNFVNDSEEEENIDEDLKTYYRKQAKTFGIEIDNPQNRIDRMVKIGIQDLNPTRVLKKCGNLEVKIESYGKPAEWLNLPTAGFKSISCSIKNIKIESLSLDDAYETFSQEYCKDCNHQEPRSEDWEWDYNWD